MSLPPDFQNAADYFEESTRFLRKHQFLYNFENTRVLSLDVLENINVDELKYENVFCENYTLKDARNSNIFVTEVLEQCERLKPDFGAFRACDGLERDVIVPLGPKKRHEVAYLAKEIEVICQTANCTTVVDLGSGLGYLDQLIYSRNKCQVLGIECNDQHYVNAKKRQRKYHEDSKGKVKFRKHTITDASNIEIIKYLNEFIEHGNICITGLHACADLTVDAINLYLKIPEAKALILMPCCYHKMLVDFEKKIFKNFPLSATLKKVYEQNCAHEFLKVPFLRLASQPCYVGQSLKDLVFNLLARAVLQLYADQHGYKLTRKKRKAVNTIHMQHNFDRYVESASYNFLLTCKSDHCITENCDDNSLTTVNDCRCDLEFNHEELSLMWINLCNELTFMRAAIFILLQRHLQPIFENFILFDRLTFLHENGINDCSYRKIVDEKISPRCLALIVNK